MEFEAKIKKHSKYSYVVFVPVSIVKKLDLRKIHRIKISKRGSKK